MVHKSRKFVKFPSCVGIVPVNRLLSRYLFFFFSFDSNKKIGRNYNRICKFDKPPSIVLIVPSKAFLEACLYFQLHLRIYQKRICFF